MRDETRYRSNGDLVPLSLKVVGKDDPEPEEHRVNGQSQLTLNRFDLLDPPDYRP